METYEAIIAKAEQLNKKKAALEATEKALKDQIDSLTASLVVDYGEDYMARFNAAVSSVQAWDANA
jgi:hypothetical protein